MYCSKCGSKLLINSKFCNICGSKTRINNETNKSNQTSNNKPHNPSKSKLLKIKTKDKEYLIDITKPEYKKTVRQWKNFKIYFWVLFIIYMTGYALANDTTDEEIALLCAGIQIIAILLMVINP